MKDGVWSGLNPYDKFTQVSFVNGLFTAHGGSHMITLLTNM